MTIKIGIRPTIDGRCNGVRESVEEQTMAMAVAAKALIEREVRCLDGTPVEAVVADTTIGGGAEAAMAAEKFKRENVVATLTVTPCWCYGTETMDLDPLTLKAVWGFNGTERPGAVYLAAVMAAYAQRGLPAFSVYGRDVADRDAREVPEDVRAKILRFARCAAAVGQMRDKAYVGIGAVSMGIMGSFVEPQILQRYFGLRAEWVDMSELIRRIEKEIYDAAEYRKAMAWVKRHCPPGDDNNREKFSAKEKEAQWEYVVKMALVIKDIFCGNPVLKQNGWSEESLGRNAALGGFQGQRQWTDFKPNGDFAEAVLNSTFDWNGRRPPLVLATENDSLNGLCMLLGNYLTHRASVFADVRTYWSPAAVERVTGWKPEGRAARGFIHLCNSGAAALDGTGAARGADGQNTMKPWYEVTEEDMARMLGATRWAPAERSNFRGGGFSSQYATQGEMPVTMMRLNIVDGVGPVMQLAEGWTLQLPDDVHRTLLNRTDPTWPSTWFVPRLQPGDPAFSDVYTVMADWGANHGAFCYGHIGAELITLCAMLRIPVSMHNVPQPDIFRPHAWTGFGTKDPEGADYRACGHYGPLYG